jgi:hypothetical protein
MKTYTVTIARTSFVEITVEAISKDDAEAQAWEEQDLMRYEWKHSDEWETYSIDETFAREEA